MIDITTFQNYGEGLDGWSYRGQDRCRRKLSDTVALFVFASDLGGWEGKYGTEQRETHVRTVGATDGEYALSAPITLSAPLEGEQLEIRTICLEIEGADRLADVLEDLADGFQESLGGHQPRPWNDPFLAFGSSSWMGEIAPCHTLFEDCWTVGVDDPGAGGREPLQAVVAGDAQPDTVTRHLARRGISRLVSFESDGSVSHERRRYRHQGRAADCAIGVAYTA